METDTRTHQIQERGSTDITHLITVPYFYGHEGEDPEDYLQSLEALGTVGGFRQEHIILLATQYLRGHAKLWWKGITHKPTTMTQLAKALRDTFWGEIWQEQQFKTISRDEFGNNPEETLSQYFRRKTAELRSLDKMHISENRMIRIITALMPQDVQIMTISSGIRNMEEMTKFIESIETTLTSEALSQSQIISTGLTWTEGRGDQPITPIINVGVEGQCVRALIDTGSQVSLAAQKWAEHLETLGNKIPRLPMKGMEIRLANGRIAKAGQHQIWLKIQMGTEQIEHPFVTLEGLIQDLVLGNDFLCKNGAKIDYQQGILQIGHTKIPMGKQMPNDIPQVQTISTKEAEVLEEDMITRKIQETDMLSEEQRERTTEIMQAHSSIFTNNPGTIRGYVHRIRVKDSAFFRGRTYPIPFQYQESVRIQIEEMIRLGIIERSPSPYNNPIVISKKKDGSARICLDARRLNSVTIPECDAPPKIHELLMRLAGKKIFSTLDLTASYWQIELHPEDRQYTAFKYEGRSHVFKRVPFGLINSGAALMRCLDQAISEKLKQHLICYMDDVVVASENVQQHILHLRQLFDECKDKNISINLSKSHFAKSQISFLGHLVDGEGVRPHPDKIEAIHKFMIPKKLKQLRAFLGLCNFYHKFYPGFAQDTGPLVELLKKDHKWKWAPQQDEAFNKIKQKFLQAVMIHYPDLAKPMYLQTDSSQHGLGAVLFQKDQEGKHKVIYFISRTLRQAEARYTVTEQEALAIVWACEKLHQFLVGSQVIIRTDHRALEFLNQSYLTSNRLIRWAIKLQAINYQVEYCPGKDNIVADTLSRHPVTTECPEATEEDDRPQVMITRTGGIDGELQDMAKWQREYGPYRRIIEVLEGRRRIHTRDRQRILDRYRMQDSTLQQRIHKQDPTWRSLIPPEMRTKTIREAHNRINHYGAKKTEEVIKRSLYFPHMYKAVRKVIQSCEVCGRNKPPNQAYRGPIHPITTSRPNEILAIDHYGPLPPFKQYKYLLVTYDIFTKLVQAYPMRRADSASTIRALRQIQFTKVGRPETILSDRGTAFTSREWRQWIEKERIHHRMTSVRNPQSNPCERVMRELGRSFRTVIGQNHKGWVNALETVIDAINRTKNETTGFSPRWLHYGNPDLPVFKTKSRIDNSGRNVEKDREQVRRKLEHEAQRRIQRDQRPTYFKVGDHVWVRHPRLSNKMEQKCRKFFPLYDGPYIVDQDLHNNSYVITNQGKRIGTYNARSLKPYRGRDA